MWISWLKIKLHNYVNSMTSHATGIANEMLEPGFSLDIMANRTPKGVMLAGHAFRLFVSQHPSHDLPHKKGRREGDFYIYQAELTGDRVAGFPTERRIHDAVAALRDRNLIKLAQKAEEALQQQDMDLADRLRLEIQKGLSELAAHLHAGEYVWKIFKELYSRYEILKVQRTSIPSDNPSRWYTGADYRDPSYRWEEDGIRKARRAESADMVIVTSAPDADIRRVVEYNEENKRLGVPDYHMYSRGDTRSCTTYCSDLGGLLGHSDEELFDAYPLDSSKGYISRDTRHAVGRLLRERRREDPEHFECIRVPIEGQEGQCLSVYNILLADGKTRGTIILNPPGNVRLDPLVMVETAWAAGAIKEIPGVKDPSNVQHKACENEGGKAERPSFTNVFQPLIEAALGEEPKAPWREFV